MTAAPDLPALPVLRGHLAGRVPQARRELALPEPLAPRGLRVFRASTGWMALLVKLGQRESVLPALRAIREAQVPPAIPGTQAPRAQRAIPDRQVLLAHRASTVSRVAPVLRAQLAVRARQAPQAIPAVRVRPDHRALTV